MSIIIVSDIFGQHQYLDDFSRALTGDKLVTIIDPYQGKYLDFTDEDHAYQTFLAQCGHDKYAEIVLKTIDHFTRSHPAIIVAFSAGASATWRAIAKLSPSKQTNIKHFIGFYPSQIRHYLHLSPQVNTQFVFPKYESHFSVDDVIEKLSIQTSVKCIKADYLHGFMNPLSINCNLQAKLLYIQELQKIISNTRFLGS